MKNRIKISHGVLHIVLFGGLITAVAWGKQHAVAQGKSCGFWARWRGRKGIAIERRYAGYMALFSERNGYRKVRRLGPFAVEVLA